MPTPPKVPQVEQAIPSQLVFRPHNPGDPGPDIWSIIAHLQPQQQVEFARTVLASQIAVEQAHVDGLKQIHGAIGDVQGP
jgi:hypothetical protein